MSIPTIDEKKERIKASKRAYEKKRELLPQFPRQFIDIETESKVNDLLAIYKNKKEILLAGINLLHKKNINKP